MSLGEGWLESVIASGLAVHQIACANFCTIALAQISSYFPAHSRFDSQDSVSYAHACLRLGERSHNVFLSEGGTPSMSNEITSGSKMADELKHQQDAASKRCMRCCIIFDMRATWDES